jgi:hypothetical protein
LGYRLLLALLLLSALLQPLLLVVEGPLQEYAYRPIPLPPAALLLAFTDMDLIILLVLALNPRLGYSATLTWAFLQLLALLLAPYAGPSLGLTIEALQALLWAEPLFQALVATRLGQLALSSGLYYTRRAS